MNTVTFSATVNNKENKNVLELKGEFTGDHIVELKRLVDDLKIRNMDSVLIDMTGVDFIDSKGAAFLLNVKQKFNDRKLALAGVRPDVHKVLTRLYLAEQFRIYGAVEEALMRM